MPVISVIVPIYNVSAFLPDCLRSIEAQKYTDYELILVDDGSTDNSGSLCDAWAENHPNTRVIHQENRGLSGARNAGLDVATGEYIAFVDSDDTIRPRFLGELLKALQDADADMALCAVEDVAEDGESATPPALTNPVRIGAFPARPLLNDFYGPDGPVYTVAWNKLYRAQMWKELRYPQGRLYEDDAVAHRLYWDAKIVVTIEQPLYCYRQREGSICRTALRPSAFDGVLALVDRCQFLNAQNADRDTQAHALAACWKRYLYLCSLVAEAPTEALVARITATQPVMQALLAPVPSCRYLKMQEKLSACRWSMMGAPGLCPLPKQS